VAVVPAQHGPIRGRVLWVLIVGVGFTTIPSFLAY